MANRPCTPLQFLLFFSALLISEHSTQVVVPTGNGGFKAYTMNMMGGYPGLGMGYGMGGLGGFGGYGGYLGYGMPFYPGYGMYG